HRARAARRRLRAARVHASSGDRAGAAAVRADAAAAVRSSRRDAGRGRFLAAANSAFTAAAETPLPGRDRGDAVVHLAVPLADRGADVERLRAPRYRSARQGVYRRGVRIGSAVADDLAVSECVDAGGDAGGGDARWPEVPGVLALPRRAVRG